MKGLIVSATSDLRIRSMRRLFAVCLALSSCAALAWSAPAASAAPAHTDVMFVFDTTGSMGGAIEEAEGEIQQAMSEMRAQLPDPEFGLAEMKDYTEVQNGSFEYDEEDASQGFQPWTLEVPISSNEGAVSAALAGLSAEGGGDGPEAYGRALFESATNPAVGWRPGARGVIVLVADNVPHDNELNEGIASPPIESPFDTGIDPGRDNTVGTADDLDWQSTVLPDLVKEGRPLEFVDYHGAPEYLPYWENWTARTGGNALEAGEEEGLASTLTALVVAGANAPLPSCPAGTVRDATEHCAAPPPGPLPAPIPAPVPSNAFSVVPKISCVGGCHIILVKVTFDSAGTIVMESVLPATKGAARLQAGNGQEVGLAIKGHKKAVPLIKRLSGAVQAGPNTLKVKLSSAAFKKLKAKGHLKVKVRLTFTPTGGTPKATTVTFNVKLPKKTKG